MEEDTVRLKIKSPSFGTEDIEMDCPLGLSIARLKLKISEEFPGNPAPSEQKLVYGGKLIQDTATLLETLRLDPDCPVHSLHLVCSLPLPTTLPNTAMPPYPAVNPVDQWQTSFYSQLSGGSLTPPLPDMDQALMMEIYRHYLEAQYWQLQQMTQLGAGVEDPGPVLPQAPVVGEARVGQPIPVPLPQGEARGPQVLNAGAGPAFEDDEGENGQGDILYWLYMTARLMVVFSIVYFYSNVTRFLVIMGIALLFYMYQAGHLGQGRRGIRRQIPRRLRRVGDRHDLQANPADVLRGNIGGEDVDEDRLDLSNVQEVGPRNPFSMAANFVTMFFASLIPEQPEVI